MGSAKAYGWSIRSIGIRVFLLTSVGIIGDKQRMKVVMNPAAVQRKDILKRVRSGPSDGRIFVSLAFIYNVVLVHVLAFCCISRLSIDQLVATHDGYEKLGVFEVQRGQEGNESGNSSLVKFTVEAKVTHALSEKYTW